MIDVWGPGRVGIKLSPGGGLGDVGMSRSEQINQYSYLITELDKRPLAYILLVRYLGKLKTTALNDQRLTFDH